MKIRNGFVSNSSSSSFLIAFDRKEKSYVQDDFGNKRRKYGDSTYIDAMGHKEVLDTFKEWYGLNRENDDCGWGGPDDVARFYKRAAQVAQCVDVGREVAIINISYHDEDGNDAIGEYEVIESLGG